jgi:hypothetical protein
MKCEIIDDFLDPGYYNLVAKTFMEQEGIAWDYSPNISGTLRNDLSISHQGFSHTIFQMKTREAHIYPLMLPMIERIRYMIGHKYCYRMRSDMTLQTGERRVFDHHVDINHVKHTSGIFYLNDSDGDTILYNEECPVGNKERPALEDLTEYKRITPKANRLLLFEGNYWHTGESPVDSARRVIFNMNFGDEDI